MVSSLIGETRSAVPSSNSSESLEEQHTPNVQVLDATGYHRMGNVASYPRVEESHRLQHRIHIHTSYPPAPPAQHFHRMEGSASPPPVTPSPSSPTQTPYRFETPAYVFAPPTSNILEQLKSSAGCTCKKSRYVLNMYTSFITCLQKMLTLITFPVLSQLPQTLLSMLCVLDNLRPEVPLRRMSQYHGACVEH
jgi:hypothetical protein